MQVYEHSITLWITIDYSVTVKTVLRRSKDIRRMCPNMSADASSDVSAGTCSEMNLNIEFFVHVGTD